MWIMNTGLTILFREWAQQIPETVSPIFQDYPLFIIHYSLSTIHYPLSTIHCFTDTTTLASATAVYHYL
jgi:hypothetical protein